MKGLVLLLVICVWLVQGEVVKVSSADIEQLYASNDLVILNFCTSWSTQCQDFRPQFELASNEAYPFGKVIFGEVDAKAEGKLRAQYNIWSYPYIMARKKDQSVVTFKGRATAKSLTTFVKRVAFTNLNPINTAEQIDEFLHLEDVAVLGYFETDKKEYNNFFEIFKKLQTKLMISFTTNQTHFKQHYEANLSPAAVMVYKRMEGTMKIYKNDFTMSVLSKWLLENTKVPVNYVHPENVFKYLGFKIPGVLMFIDTLNYNTSLTESGLTAAVHGPNTPTPLEVTTITSQAISTTIISRQSSPNFYSEYIHTESNSPSSHSDTQNPTTSTKTTRSNGNTHSSTHTSHSSSSSHSTHTTTTTTTTQTHSSGSKSGKASYSSSSTKVYQDADGTIISHEKTEYCAEDPSASEALMLPAVSTTCDGGAFLPCLALMHKLAPLYKDRLNFIYTDGKHYRPFMERLGLSKLPGIVIMDWAHEKHYIFEGSSVTSDSLEQFFATFFGGDLVHNVRSAPLPNEEDPSGIVHVVSDNFQEVVLDKTKSVLVNFHLPWCGYCKAVWQSYFELVKLAAGNDVVIAEYDVSQNDAPRGFPYEWPKDFPHIALFPAGDQEPIAMVDDPSLENLVKFLQNNVPGFAVKEDKTLDE